MSDQSSKTALFAWKVGRRWRLASSRQIELELEDKAQDLEARDGRDAVLRRALLQDGDDVGLPGALSVDVSCGLGTALNGMLHDGGDGLGAAGGVQGRDVDALSFGIIHKF